MDQVMIIKLKVEEPKIIFDPLFKEIRDIILRCFSEIIASGDGLTRVSFLLLLLLLVENKFCDDFPFFGKFQFDDSTN
jgi:dynein heavy chain